MKNLVIYHKNCMDGIGAAYAWSLANSDNFYIPIQHGSKEKENFMEMLPEKALECKELVFLDFSIGKEELQKACEHFERVLIIDHHKSLKEDLKNFENDKLGIIFVNTKSGAQLTWEYVKSHVVKDNSNYVNQLDMIFDYIGDRDLWKWELPNSKEFSEGLRFLFDINRSENMTDIEAFEAAISLPIKKIAEVGENIEKYIDIKTSKKIDKIAITTLFDSDGNTHDVAIINSPEDISILGNKICLEYNMVAACYFITDTGNVVFSLRSLDSLPDASKIAVNYGGNGHRNACGFSESIDFLKAVLEVSVTLEEYEKERKDNDK